MEVDNTITYKFQSPKLLLFDSKQKKIASVIPNTTNIICILKKKISNTKWREIHSRRRILAKDIVKNIAH